MAMPSESYSFRDYHESFLPDGVERRSDALPRAYAESLRPLGIQIRETGEAYTYAIDWSGEAGPRVGCRPGADDASTLVELDHESWAGLTRDLETAAGLIYGERARYIRGDLMHFVHWEPALRWLFAGLPVYDPGAIELRDLHGEPLDPTRSFTLDDDREEMAHFLRTVGYLWVRNVFSPEEVAVLQREAEALGADAREGDQESWWGRRADGTSVLCRVLRAGKQPALRALHSDPRLRGLAALCDVPMDTKQGAEDKDGVTVLWKQPGVVEGLGDLPWHRDCGMGGHASMCPTAVLSVFLGPNTPEAGEIRFLPGSWRTSFPFAEEGDSHAPQGVGPPACPGDVTFHYGDGMHVAPPPTSKEGPHRCCVLMGFARVGGRHHRGGRHYNDILLGREDGQVENMRKVASRG